MRKKLDLLWLFLILVVVSLAVYWTPYEIPLPRPPFPSADRYPTATPALQLSGGRYLKLIPTCPAADVNTYNPDSFRYKYTGSRHGKAYTGFNGDATNYPQYEAEEGLLDHP
ncbi:hypothetical protein IV102_30220 [bacterium]|nr:hypothetical protein [bacterium]